MIETEARIVTVGGGNGNPVINESLLGTGMVSYINVISAVFDMGGATGRRRTDSRGMEIAYSDPMRNLASLADPNQRNTPQYKALLEHLKSRQWGKVLGQDVFAHFHRDGDGFDGVQEHLTNLTGINFMGKVLPSTAESTNIKFSTGSGRIYTGENQLDEHYMSKDMVVDMWLEKDVLAYTDAKDAIEKATLIILACGSVRGSVLCNTLPLGMREAFHRSQAQIYLVTNLVSTRNETHDFKPADFAALVNSYIGEGRLNGLIVPEVTRAKFEEIYPEVSYIYDLDHSYFLGWEDNELKMAEETGIKIVTHNATIVVDSDGKERTVRHDPSKLSEALKSLL